MKILLIMVSILLTQNSYSANCTQIKRDLVKIHFGNSYSYYDHKKNEQVTKKVVGVMAHLGSYIVPRYNRQAPYWTNINNISLPYNEDKEQFENTLDITTFSGIYNPNEELRVQYFLTYEDKSMGNTPEYVVKMKRYSHLSYPTSDRRKCSDYDTSGRTESGRGNISDREMRCLFGDDIFDWLIITPIEQTERVTAEQVDC